MQIKVPYVPIFYEIAKALHREKTFNALCLSSIILAAFLFYRSFTNPLNYGRFYNYNAVKHGLEIRPSLAFFIFNIVPVFLFTYNVFVYAEDTTAINPINVPVIAYILFRLYRATIYPFMRPKYSKSWPISVVLYYLSINCLLAIIEARTVMYEYWGFEGALNYILLAVFVIAFYYNVTTDLTMCGHRTNKKNGYRVLKGGLFNYVSQPNYFSEVVMWLSWVSMCTVSVGTFVIIAFMFALFVGRAKMLQRWNKKYFSNWKVNTTPIIPGIEFQPERGEYLGIFDFMAMQ